MTKAGARGAEDKDADKGAGSTARPAFAAGEGSADLASVKIPPLMTHPTAAMAAATAIGLGIASQWAGVMAGMLQGVAASMEKTAAQQAETLAAAEVEKAEAAAPVKADKADKAGSTVAADGKTPATESVRKKDPAAAPVSVTKAAGVSNGTAAVAAKPVAAAKPRPAARSSGAKDAAMPQAPVAAVKQTAGIAAKGAAGEKKKAVAPAAAAAQPQRKAAAKAPKAKTADGPDDLKKIAGIGPRVEQELLAKGVTRIAVIAGWSAAEAERIDAELGLSGRVLRDDWIGKARAIVAGA